jgi:hypothetical protein
MRFPSKQRASLRQKDGAKQQPLKQFRWGESASSKSTLGQLILILRNLKYESSTTANASVAGEGKASALQNAEFRCARKVSVEPARPPLGRARDKSGNQEEVHERAL